MPPRIGIERQRRKTFLREYRLKKGWSLERAAEVFIELGFVEGMSPASLSRIERRLQPYTQDFLEAAAEAYGTDVASLLMRDPSDPDGIWTVWDNALPGERSAIVDHAKITLKRRVS